VVNRREKRYVSSHRGYSVVGQAITLGSFPALLAIAAFSSKYEPPVRWAVLAVGLVPAAIWLSGKALGPDRWPWFYREPGTVTFSARGIDWTSALPGTPREGHVDWGDIAGVDRRSLRFGVVGLDDHVVVQIRADLTRLRPIDREEDWSYAQALVAYLPEDFVLTELVVNKMPAGARRRRDGEPASQISPLPLNRSSQVALAIYIAVIGLVSLIGAIVRR
jgi:hypothetical protein